MDAVVDGRTALMVLVLLGVVVALAVRVWVRWFGPLRRQRRASRRLRFDHARGLPTAVVLLQLAVRGGNHPRQAIAAICDLPLESGALSEVAAQLRQVRERLELGADLTSAMLAVDPALGDLHRVLDSLRRAEVDGGPLVGHLEVLVSDLRRQRRTALDGAAQRLTVSMLFPLVVCILPAFILLAVIPLVHAALSGLPG